MKKINRRSFLAVCGAAAAAGALAACGGSSSRSTAASSSTASSASSTASSVASSASEAANDLSSLSGTVATGGSTSMNSVIEALSEGFAEVAPGVTVSYDLDIGLASRALHDDETGVTATTVALDGIAMVVNNENPVSDLSIEQLAQIFKKEVTNWADVGGEDGEIVVIGREAGSGTRDGFESIVGVEDACVYDQELTATGAVISAVASNKLAIGYASLSAVGDTVKTLTVEGVECSEATVLDGTYKVQRPFNFITNDAAELSDAAKAFIDFAVSEDAAELIRLAGAVPLVDAE